MNYFYYITGYTKSKIVSRNGKELYRTSQREKKMSNLMEFLTTLGYEVKELQNTDHDRKSSKNSIFITCNNEDCRHYNEMCKGKCRVKIKATIESNDRNPKVKESIVVSYLARDIRELTAKSECLLWHIKDETGIEGSADIYGKMELC